MKKMILFLLCATLACAQTESGGTTAAGQRGALVPTFLGASLSFSPDTSINFGQVSGPTTRAITLSNPGNTALSGLTLGALATPFSYTTTCGSTLGALGGSCTVSVTFAPTQNNTYSATLQINSSIGVNFLALSGVGTGSNPIASVSPTSLLFSSQPVGTTSPQQFLTYSNTGSSPLLISSIAGSGPFAVNDIGCRDAKNNYLSLAPSSSCSVGVGYSPSVTSSIDHGTVVFTDNSAQSPISVALTGEGGTPASSSAASISGYPAGRYLEFQTTSAMLAGSGVAISEVADTNQFCAAPAGASCTATLSPAPVAGHALVAHVRIASTSITLSSLKDNLGDTFTCVTPTETFSSQATQTCYLLNIPSGITSVVESFSGSLTTAAYLSVTEYAGLNGVDKTSGTTVTNATTITSPSVTTTAANELLDAYCNGNGPVVVSAGTGWTGLWGGNTMPMYRIVSSTGAYSANCFISPSAAGGIILVTFTGGASASGPNAAYSSVAELGALDQNGNAIPRTNNTFVSTSTLAAISANNTSACTSQAYCSAAFTGMSNNADAGAQTVVVNPAPVRVSTSDIHTLLPAGTKVIAHSTDWFTAPGTGTHQQSNYNSNDANTVAAQDNDMIARHFDGRVTDWYSQFNTVIDGAAQKIKADLEAKCSAPQNCPLEFGIVEDQGAVTQTQGSRTACGLTDSACMQTSIMQDLCYMNATYFGSAAYWKMNPTTHAWATSTNPVVLMFPPSTTTGWNTAVSNIKALVASNGWAAANCPAGQQGANGGLLLVDIDTTSVTNSQYMGGGSWIDPQAWSTSNQLIWDGTNNNTYHEALYSSCNANTSDVCIGSAKNGFDDYPNPPFANWGTNRIMAQQCGQVWMNSLGLASKFTGSNLTMQLATWNDYEEGSEIETGINSCYSASTPTLSGTILSWAATSSDSTYAPLTSGAPTGPQVANWRIWMCSDSTHCAVAKDNIPLSTTSVDLSTLGIPSGTYNFYLELVGQPDIQNVLSAASPAYVSPALNWSVGATSPTKLAGIHRANTAADLTTVTDAESWLGTKFAIKGMPYNWCDTTAAENTALSLMTSIWNSGSVPMVSWNSYDLCQLTGVSGIDQLIANGQDDAYINAWVSLVRNWVAGPDGVYGTSDDRRVYIRFDQEMNGTWFNWSSQNGNTAASFIAMWQHVFNLWFTANASNGGGVDSNHVQFVWCVFTGQSAPASWYPGDAYVHWLSVDGYSNTTPNTAPSTVFGSTVTALNAINSTKPIMIAETGDDNNADTTNGKLAWLTAVYNYAQNTAQIHSIVYYDNSFQHNYMVFGCATTANCPSTSSEAIMGAFGDVQNLAINSSIYNTFSTWKTALSSGWTVPDPNNPRLLSDAQFSGLNSSGGCDSADTNQPCVNAIDGNNGTFWQSQTVGSTIPQPHSVTVDMGATNILSAITVLPRQDGCSNGWPVNYDVFLDSVNPPQAKVASGTFTYNTTVACPGGGTPPAFNVGLANSSGNFGSVNVGASSAQQTFYLTSTGATTLSITGITLSDSTDYSETNTCGTLPASLAVNSTCTITVTFNPQAASCLSANSPCTLGSTLSITTNAPNSPSTVTLTGQAVNAAKTLQTITVLPASPNVPVNSSQQMTATCNYSDGSSAVCTSTWALSNNTATGTTISTGGLVTTSATAGTATITATVSGISGTTVLNVVSSNDLLPTACAGPSGIEDCTTGSAITTPTGWTVLCTVGYESGTPSGTTSTLGKCDTGTSTGGSVNFGATTATTAAAHHGAQSWSVGTYGGPGGGGFESVALPSTSHEVYLSWWQMLPSWTNAGIYDAPDFYTADFLPGTGAGEMTLNSINDTNCTPLTPFEMADERLGWQPQGVSLPVHYYGCVPVPFDSQWHHWEIHYLANTQTNGVANSDGLLQIWRDGTPLTSDLTGNLNNLANMNGIRVHIGGHFESIIWTAGSSCQCGGKNANGSCNLAATCSGTGKPSCDSLWATNANGSTTTEGSWGTACGTAIGNGYGCDVSHFTLSELGGNYPPGSFANVNNACAGQAPQTTFTKYFDDVIVLYK